MVTLLLGLVLAGVGAVAGTAFHWFVIEPSDDELLSAAEEVRLTGYTGDEPALDAFWAPSMTRGSAHWDTVSDGPLDAEAVAADLSDAGWTITGTEPGATNATARVHAVDGRLAAGVFLSSDPDGGTHASISVSRRTLPPTLTACVLVGTLVGAAGGSWLGWRVAR
jgi:hypothetical protein